MKTFQKLKRAINPRKPIITLLVYNALSDVFEEPETILARISEKTRHSLTKMQLIGILNVLCNYGYVERRKIKVKIKILNKTCVKSFYIYRRAKNLD